MMASHPGTRRRRRLLQRFTGTVGLVAVILVALAVLISLAIGIYPQRSLGFEVVPREPYTHSFDPIALAELGLAPKTLPLDQAQLAAYPRNPDIRLIAVAADRIDLIAAGSTVRSIATATPIENVAELIASINDPSWIEMSTPGLLVLKTALVTMRGVNFTIGGPFVRDVSLLAVPSVFIGTRGGELLFDGVNVHSIQPNAGGSEDYRPFVLATDAATMTMTNSHFFDLGWDWNASYGVSWEQGSTGSAVDSHFERNFIGVYTGRSDGLKFTRCVFRENALYGLDPHTYSRHLTIDSVLAERNGAHGIIFSDYVRDSVVKNSISRDNGENGIMMDKHSTDNQIIGNQVYGNRGDGLVIARSPHNAFTANTVTRNRVGIRVTPSDAAATTLLNNRIEFNDSAAEDIVVLPTNVVVGNGGQWNWPIMRIIWSVSAGVLALSSVYVAAFMVKRGFTVRRRLSAVR